jgi:hypothetical protein
VLPGLHERGAGSRIRLGLLSALWHATPRAKPRAFKFTLSTCGNNARNSMATTDDFSLLDRAVSNYCRKPQSRTAVTNRLLAPVSAGVSGGMIDHRLVANVAMATAVSGDLTGTSPGDVLSSHRASELTGQSPLPLLSPVPEADRSVVLPIEFALCALIISPSPSGLRSLP